MDRFVSSTVRVVMLCLIASGAAANFADAQVLFPGVTAQTGSGPRFAAVGDVSGDGKPDLVIANAKANTVSVALNKGDGTFAPKKDYFTDTTPACVVIADVNGDGKPDLVTANFGSTTVSVLFNNGNGTFAARKDYAVGTHPAAIAVADFNGDGKPDIVAANFDSNTVSFLPNIGLGAFGAKTDIAVGSGPISIAAADFNGDGKPDFVTANNVSNTVSIVRGLGNGTFAAKADYTIGNFPESVSVGDVNGDGKPDIVTANYFGGSVNVLLNNGTGGIVTNSALTLEKGIFSVALADVNGDGKLDLIATNADNNNVSVLRNLGSGSFGARAVYGVASLPYCVAAGDVNSDGKLDIVIANYGSDNAIVLQNSGNGVFAARSDTPTGTQALSTALADFNGDGKPDLVTANFGTATRNYGNTLSVYLNNGSGYSLKTDYTVGLAPTCVVAADVNGDGRPDLIATTSIKYDAATNKYLSDYTVSVLLNRGDGTFAPRVDYGGGNLYVAVGDLNGDGKPDIVTVDGIDSIVLVLYNVGNGAFTGLYGYGVGRGPVCVTLADVNGDGRLDIITANDETYDSATGQYVSGHSVSVLLNTGSGNFPATTSFAPKTDYPVGGRTNYVTVGDVDGDGRPDIAVSRFYDSTVSLLRNNGNGTFGAKTDITVSSPENIALADVNGDGKLDLAVCRYEKNSVGVLLGKGDGTFGAEVDYATGSSPATVLVGDVNGDGKPDIVTGNIDGYSLSVLLNQDAGAAIAGKVKFEGIAASAAPQNVTLQFRPVGGGANITQVRKINLDGAFTVMNVPAGNYNLWVKGDKYLAVAVSVNTSGGNSVVGLNILLHGGDGNNDNSVDSSDFTLLIGAYNSDVTAPGSGYDAQADFDGDGSVDSNDFTILIGNFGQVGDN